MTKVGDPIEDVLSLVEQNFDFLHVGKFLEEYIRKNDLRSEARTFRLEFSNGTYRLLSDQIRIPLSMYISRKNEPTTFGYLVEWNAFRGIGMAMREGLDKFPLFKDFVKGRLNSRYEHYYSVLCFIRNVLSHNVHNEIELDERDYKRTRDSKKFKESIPDGIATFTIKYADDFPDTKAPPDYAFKIEVNFNALSVGKRFTDVISEWHLFMFSELCFIWWWRIEKNWGITEVKTHQASRTI